ncbi:hypothetical protein OROHE_004618 [Orobanche hederae]
MCPEGVRVKRLLTPSYMVRYGLSPFLEDPPIQPPDLGNRTDNSTIDSTGGAHLDWKTRFSIINGIARGILYLHY